MSYETDPWLDDHMAHRVLLSSPWRGRFPPPPAGFQRRRGARRRRRSRTDWTPPRGRGHHRAACMWPSVPSPPASSTILLLPLRLLKTPLQLQRHLQRKVSRRVNNSSPVCLFSLEERNHKHVLCESPTRFFLTMRTFYPFLIIFKVH